MVLCRLAWVSLGVLAWSASEHALYGGAEVPAGEGEVAVYFTCAASLEHLSPHHCFSGPVGSMAATRMCAASPDAGVCPGDSGSPAMVFVDGAPVLVGVVSLAIDARACSDTAAVLTRVSAVRAWIESVVPSSA